MRNGLSLRWRIILVVAGLALLLLLPLTSITFHLVVGERLSEVDLPLYPFLIAGGVGVLGLVLILYLSLDMLILAPLHHLAEDAASIRAGDLDHPIELDRADEVGRVARTFNDAVSRLREEATHLEGIVAERTDALQRRNAQLEAMALVSQEAARERAGATGTPVNALLETAVDAVSEHFGFYHTGIYILDDNQEWAVLRAASSEGGRRMLSRGHRVRVAQATIVGYVAARGVPRVAFDGGQDAAAFDDVLAGHRFSFEHRRSDLPLTKSEAALPMMLEGRVVGVLDVQSDEEMAFSDDDLRMLHLMADQLTVALNNARTLERMEATLAELQQLQVDYSRRGWARVTKRMRPLAYEYDQVDTIPVAPLPVPDELAAGAADHSVVLDGGTPVVMEPMRVGDQTLGYLGLSDPKRVWSEEELALVRSIGEQVALALDNARLFEDTQRNERQQYLISRVLQAGSDPELDAEEVLQEIAQILAQGLDMAVVIFTFPHPDAPVVHSHAVVSPEGELISLIDEDLTLSEEHFVFFRGLTEPEFGPIMPLLGRAGSDAGATASPIDATGSPVNTTGSPVNTTGSPVNTTGSPPGNTGSQEDSEGPSVGLRAGLEGYDLQRVLYVPIVSAGIRNGFIGLIQPLETTGSLDVSSPVDPDTRELAQSLAGQISVVLENLNLSEQTRQRSEELRELYRISLVLSELLEPSDVLQAIVEHGTRLLDAEGADLWVYDPETERLTIAFDTGVHEGRSHELARRALSEQRTVIVPVDATGSPVNATGSPVNATGSPVNATGSPADATGTNTTNHKYADRAMMAVPLVGRFGPLGVLVLVATQSGYFGESQAGLAELFSAQAAAALENARLNRDAQRRAEEFSQLYEAGIDLITILDAEELLDRAADWARRVLDAERAAVYVKYPETGVYLSGQSVSEPRYRLDPDTGDLTEGGPTETILGAQESVLIRDHRESSAANVRRLVHLGLLSQMGAPLRVGTEVLGAVFVNGAEVGRFDARDLDLLEFLATQVSSALQNSIQFGQTERALAVVGRQARYQANISQAVALLNEQGTEAAADVLRLLGEAAGVSLVLYFDCMEDSLGDGSEQPTSVWRLDEAWLGNGSREGETWSDEPLELAVDQLPAWARALTEDGYAMSLREDLPAPERESLTVRPFEALLGLAVPGEAYEPGFVALYRDAPTLWSEQEIIALQTVAAAMSNTVARESLFEQVQRTLSETEALYRGGAALSEVETYQDILEVLLEHTVLGREAHKAALCLFDRAWTGDDLPSYADVVASWSADPETRVRRRHDLSRHDLSRVQGVPLVSNGAEEMTPLFIEDLAQHPHLTSDLGESTRTGDARGQRLVSVLLHPADGAQSLILLPLTVGGQRIGYLHADYQDAQTFTEADRRRLISLTQQAAIAVLNIRQLRATEARARREQLIRHITGRIQEAGDVQGVLRTAVQELGQAFGTSQNRIQFRPPGDQEDSDV